MRLVLFSTWRANLGDSLVQDEPRSKDLGRETPNSLVKNDENLLWQ